MDSSTLNGSDFKCREQILGALGYSTLYLWNIAACSLVTTAVVNVYRSSTNANYSFYILLSNLLLSDLSYFFLYLAVFLPQNFTCEHIFDDEVFEIMGNLGTASFVALNTNTWLISMNRFLAICFTNNCHKVFNRRNTFVLCAAAWSFGLLSVTVNNLVGCSSRFSSESLSLKFGCKRWNPVFSPHSIYCYICTYSTFIFYLRCLIVLRKKSVGVVDRNLAQSMQNKKGRVFRQALLIWLSLVTTMTSFRVMPFITNHIVYTIVNVFFAFCCPNFVPLIPVIFSREIRSTLKSLLFWKDINHANYRDRNRA